MGQRKKFYKLVQYGKVFLSEALHVRDFGRFRSRGVSRGSSRRSYIDREAA